jgi:hypothetical protein
MIELSGEPPAQGDRFCPVGPGPCHGPHGAEQVAKASLGVGPPEPLSTFHTSIIWNYGAMSSPEGRMSTIVFSGFSCGLLSRLPVVGIRWAELIGRSPQPGTGPAAP